MKRKILDSNEKFEIIDPNILQNAFGVIDEKIPKNVVNIRKGDSEDYAFLQSKNTLTKIWFEENSQLKTIGDYSFYLCSNVLSVDLSNCLLCEIIGYCAFAYCKSLNELILPPNINNIGGNVFRSVHLQKLIDLSKITSLSNIAFVDNEFSFTSTSEILKEYEKTVMFVKHGFVAVELQ